jgi:hypothetical protein
MMKLKPKDPTEYRVKSKRPSETKHISLERIARGRVSAASEELFQVELSHKRYYLFKKEDASEYNKPNVGTSIRCIYHGNKNNLLPYAVYDLLWNQIWKEK